MREVCKLWEKSYVWEKQEKSEKKWDVWEKVKCVIKSEIDVWEKGRQCEKKWEVSERVREVWKTEKYVRKGDKFEKK